MLELWVTQLMQLDVSNGTCLSHDNPDLWFAGEVDLADSTSSVNTNSIEARQQVENAITALSICRNCPAKDNCLEIGKSGDSLHYGIYGGTMPGERLAMVGRLTKNSIILQKARFAIKVRNTMTERGIQWK
jgi:hypothetical protein